MTPGGVLGLIPARGGSKGLPGKNLRLLAGKPLIAWTIGAALAARTLDAVVVSTDDEEIARVATDLGAEVPFLRPVELATDEAPTVDTVLHAVDALAGMGRSYGRVMLLQPTSPLRASAHIDAASELLRTSGAEAVVSVAETDHSPLWSNTLPSDGRLGSFVRHEAVGVRRQDLPRYYRLNGAIYLIGVEALRRERAFIGDFAVAYVMPREASVDIDTLADFEYAEFLLSREGGR